MGVGVHQFADRNAVFEWTGKGHGITYLTGTGGMRICVAAKVPDAMIRRLNALTAP